MDIDMPRLLGVPGAEELPHGSISLPEGGRSCASLGPEPPLSPAIPTREGTHNARHVDLIEACSRC